MPPPPSPPWRSPPRSQPGIAASVCRPKLTLMFCRCKDASLLSCLTTQSRRVMREMATPCSARECKLPRATRASTSSQTWGEGVGDGGTYGHMAVTGGQCDDTSLLYPIGSAACTCGCLLESVGNSVGKCLQSPTCEGSMRGKSRWISVSAGSLDRWRSQVPPPPVRPSNAGSQREKGSMNRLPASRPYVTPYSKACGRGVW